MTPLLYLRRTYRSLLKSPMVSLIAITTLAIGIAANGLLFSIVQSVLLKPLPFPGPERIYTARTTFAGDDPAAPGDSSPVSARVFAAWRRGCAGCESMALIVAGGVNLGGIESPERVDTLSVSSELFPMLGIRVQLGRGFSESDDKPGANPVVVISDGLWKRDFAADRDVIGRKIVWNRTPVEIVGVLTPDFHFPRGSQTGAMIAIPDRVEMLRQIDGDLDRLGGAFNFAAFVKLRPGVSVEHASGEMNREAERSTNRLTQRARVRLLPLKERMVQNARGPLWMLWGAAFLLLLIVCVNNGNLLMVRAAGRQREWAVRAAIGASARDLCRQALSESFLLAIVGGGIGLGVTVLGIRLLPYLSPASLPRLDEVALDWYVVSLTLLLAVGAGAICSLAPMWQILRATPQLVIASSSRVTDTKAERRGRNALVVCETGLSVVLAATAALLAVSFARVMVVDKGFRTDHVVTFQLSLEGQYTGGQRAQFHSELLEKIAALPGVASAGLVSWLPLQGETFVSEMRRPGAVSANGHPQANYRYVSSKYFEASGTPVRYGRAFSEADRGNDVAIVSESAARRLFGSASALGQTIEFKDDGGPGTLEVIGVVADVKAASLETEAPAAVYLPFWRINLGSASYVVRAPNNVAGLVPSLREATFSVASEVPIYRVREMSEIVDTAAATRRLQTWLAGCFAAAAVLLTCLGVFGIVSYNVSKRTAEIGVRVAFGATRIDVVRTIVYEALAPVSIGIVGGVTASVMLSRFLTSQLYGVRANDPVILGAVAAIVLLASLVAAARPALHASRIEPIQALHWD